jgi:hypothetical protein
MSAYQSEKDFLRALARFNSFSCEKNGWHSTVSENDQECAFGHTIPAGELYFKKYLTEEGEEALRVSKKHMENLVFLAVDCDTQARETAEHIYRRRHPKASVLETKHLR